MAKTRKKITRIQFDDLEKGMLIRAMWSSGDIVDNSQGMFVRFDYIDGENFLVLRVLERVEINGPSHGYGARRRTFDWADRGEIQVSTRAGIECWPWDRK
jgi:hypothetical protein